MKKIPNVQCNKCGYEWRYTKRSNFYITCPSCLSKVKSPYWKPSKLGNCVNCGKTFSKLVLHHTQYDPEVIVKVCVSCHRKIHFDKKNKYYPKDKRIKEATKK